MYMLRGLNHWVSPEKSAFIWSPLKGYKLRTNRYPGVSYVPYSLARWKVPVFMRQTLRWHQPVEFHDCISIWDARALFSPNQTTEKIRSYGNNYYRQENNFNINNKDHLYGAVAQPTTTYAPRKQLTARKVLANKNYIWVWCERFLWIVWRFQPQDNVRYEKRWLAALLNWAGNRREQRLRF